MHILYDALINQIKREQIIRYNLKHNDGKRTQPEVPTHQLTTNHAQRSNENYQNVNTSTYAFQQPSPKARQRDRPNMSRQVQVDERKNTNSSKISERQNPPIYTTKVPQQISPDHERVIRPKTGSKDILMEEYAHEQQERIPCTEGCGRSFAKKALDKHIRVCKKVFQEKRKEFAIKLDPEIENAKKNLPTQKDSEEQTADGVPKWQRKSQVFRLNIRRGKGTLTAEEQKLLKERENEERIQCPTCSSRFDRKVFERHKPFCQSKAKQKKKK